LFRATAWEEIEMIASENDMIQEAAETMYRLSQNEKVRLQCEARGYYRDQKTRQYQMEKMKEMEKKMGSMEMEPEAAEGKLEAVEEKLETAVINLQQQEGTIREKDIRLAKKQAEIDRLRAELERQEAAGRR